MTGRELYLAHSARLRELAEALGRRLDLPAEDARRMNREAHEELAAEGYAALADLTADQLETLFVVAFLRRLLQPAARAGADDDGAPHEKAARQLLARLSPPERLALRLHLGEGLPLEASADAAGLPQSRSPRRLRRFAARLQNLVDSPQTLKRRGLMMFRRRLAGTIFKTAAEKPKTWPSNTVEGREKPLEPRDG